MVTQTEMIYEGKAKRVYATNDPKLVIVDYKDDATAFDGKKRGTISGKGVVNNRMSNYMFGLLEKQGIPTHFVVELDTRRSLVRRVEIVKVEVIVRNIVAGSLSKRLGLPEGVVLKSPILEFCYKNDELGDPMINEYHIFALELATKEEMQRITELAFKVNDFMVPFFEKMNIDLVDFKLEFGRFDGQIILADEISPDTCRFWDKTTKERLDKDRFRRDLGNVEGAYAEMLHRVLGE
jgi:phosphoribosylaminoimidazole-succinocarboxamide synthase